MTRRKRDPYRAQVLAPKVEMPAVVCLCGHLRLMHRDNARCLTNGCDCTEYREAT